MFTLIVYILAALLLFINQPQFTTTTTIMATTDSVASSTGSNHGSITISPDDTYNSNFPIDFDPERDDAICSTLEVKRNYKQTVNPSPQMRDTAKKYGRWSPRRPQHDVIINTSALAQAFPDFSQAGSPNDTFSLEAPRGRKGKQQTTVTSSALEYTTDANTPMINLSSNLRLLKTPIQRVEPTQPTIYEDVTRNNANVRNNSNQAHTHTQLNTNAQTNTRTNTNLNTRNKSNNPSPTHFATEQKENISPIPQQQSFKRSSYTSNASRTISGDRRTFKDLHARVADESDGSLIGIERPASVTFQPKNTRFSKVTEKKQTTQTHIFTPTSLNGKSGNATQQSFFVASVLNSASNTQTNALPAVHHGKVVNGGKSLPFNEADNFDLPEDEKDIYEYARKLKAQVAKLEAALQSAHNTIDEIRADNADAAAMRTQAGIQLGKEHERLSIENQSLREEIRILKNQLAQEVQGKDNATLSLEQQDFAFKDQVDRIQDEVDRLHAEREENEHNFQQQQSDYQRRILSLSQEKQELIRNTHTLQNQKSALATQVEQLRREKDQDTRTWQQKETTFQIQIQRRDEAVQRLTNVTQHLKESTQNIEGVTKTGASKSLSGRSTKQKPTRRNHEQDLPSKVMKQAQNHMENIQAASGNLHSNNQQPPVRQHNHTQKDRVPFQALDFDLHQQAFGQNLQQSQNIPITRNDRNDTQITQEASFDDNTGELQHTQQSNDETLSDAGSNLSSIVGHGFMADINQHLKNLKTAKRQLEAADQASAHEDIIQSGRSSHAPSVKMIAEHRTVRDDTIQTIQSGRSSHAPSVKGPGGILKNSNAPQEDLTGHFSIKSAKPNTRTEQDHTSRSNTHRRHRSLVEEDYTTKSNTSHRRHHSETAVHTNTRRQTDSDDMTSAYLVADIDAAKQGNNKDRPVLSANARKVLDNLCEHHHNRGNCTICLRLASFDTKPAGKKTIQIQRPVPVTQRPTSPVPYEEEVTLRPAVSPGLALATVLKGLEDELAHLKLRHSEVQKTYMEHDSSLGRRERKALKSEIDNLLKKIDIKSDQIYALYDVLEGQAEAGQEMTQEMVDVTLTRMSLHDLDIEEEELPWEGIEESD
jgi:hypothetical protein